MENPADSKTDKDASAATPEARSATRSTAVRTALVGVVLLGVGFASGFGFARSGSGDVGRELARTQSEAAALRDDRADLQASLADEQLRSDELREALVRTRERAAEFAEGFAEIERLAASALGEPLPSVAAAPPEEAPAEVDPVAVPESAAPTSAASHDVTPAEEPASAD
jgi:hypothetical protein